MLPASIIGGLLCVLTAGCVRQSEANGVVTFTPHGVDMLLPVAIGLGLLGLGVPIVTGRLPSGRGKPLVLGTLLTIAGLFFFLGAVLTYPFERVSVTPTKLIIAQGVFGKGIAETIDLTTLDAIELFEARRSTVRSRGVSQTTVMRCHAKSSEINDVDMEGELRAAALPTVIKRANELGVKVFDSTANESE